MQLALRPYITAGVALVGAAVIVASPVAPTPPDIQVAAPAVQLSAVTYAEVLQKALDNAGILLTTALNPPAPILSQIVQNQIDSISAIATGLGETVTGFFDALAELPTALTAAFNALTDGNVVGAVNILLDAALALVGPVFSSLIPPIVNAINQPVQNLAKVIGYLLTPANITLLAQSLLAPVVSGAGATGVAIQGVVDALGAGSPGDTLNALITAPAVILDGLLNGGYGPDFGMPPVFSVFAGGILSSLGDFPVVITRGPIADLLSIRQDIAGLIGPSTSAAAATPQAGDGTSEGSVFGSRDRLVDLNAFGDGISNSLSALNPFSTDQGNKQVGTDGENSGPQTPLGRWTKLTPQSLTDGFKFTPLKPRSAKADNQTGGPLAKVGANLGDSLQQVGQNVEKTIKKSTDSVTKGFSGFNGHKVDEGD